MWKKVLTVLAVFVLVIALIGRFLGGEAHTVGSELSASSPHEVLRDFRRIEAEFANEYRNSDGDEPHRLDLVLGILGDYGWQMQAWKDQPLQVAELLKQGLELDRVPEVRAVLAYYLGVNYEAQSEATWNSPRSEIDRLVGLAEASYRASLDERADIASPGGSVRMRVERNLGWLTRSALGTPAPEIDGPRIDGPRMRLSDYRGQLVALYFWGEW